MGASSLGADCYRSDFVVLEVPASPSVNARIAEDFQSLVDAIRSNGYEVSESVILEVDDVGVHGVPFGSRLSDVIYISTMEVEVNNFFEISENIFLAEW